jgi:hypothetical protein
MVVFRGRGALARGLCMPLYPQSLRPCCYTCNDMACERTLYASVSTITAQGV